jgi:hypothetical protein
VAGRNWSLSARSEIDSNKILTTACSIIMYPWHSSLDDNFQREFQWKLKDYRSTVLDRLFLLYLIRTNIGIGKSPL